MEEIPVDPTLVLTPLSKRNLEDFYSLIQKNRVYLQKWVPSVEKVTDWDTLKNSFSNLETLKRAQLFFPYLLFFKKKYVGYLGLEHVVLEKKFCHLGYWIDQGFQGKGLMKKSIECIVEHSRKSLNLSTHYVWVHPENKPNLTLLNTLSFLTFPESRTYEGSYVEEGHILFYCT